MNFFYQKTMGIPYGEFSLELANVNNFYRIISPGDWILIYLNNGTAPSPKESLRCIGTVSRVSKKTTIANDGTKTTTWSISGYDFGKFLHTGKFFVNNLLAQGEEAQATIVGQSKYFEGSSSDLVKRFMGFFFQDRPSDLTQLNASFNNYIVAPKALLQYLKIPISGKTFFSLVDTNKYVYDNSGQELTIKLTLEPQMTFWTLLRSISNPAINELYFDIYFDGQKECPAMVFRPYPFCLPNYTNGGIYNKQFVSLNSVSISTAEIIDDALGVSDAERFNIFFIQSESDGTGEIESAGEVPLIDVASSNRHGNSVLAQATRFCDCGVGKLERLLEWQALMAHWHENNHLLNSGAITINGNPDIRLGKRLDVYGCYEDNKRANSYYIESYMDQWQFPGLWTQFLLVTRGVTIKDNKVDYLYNYIVKDGGAEDMHDTSSFSKMGNR